MKVFLGRVETGCSSAGNGTSSRPTSATKCSALFASMSMCAQVKMTFMRPPSRSTRSKRKSSPHLGFSGWSQSFSRRPGDSRWRRTDGTDGADATNGLLGNFHFGMNQPPGRARKIGWRVTSSAMRRRKASGEIEESSSSSIWQELPA